VGLSLIGLGFTSQLPGLAHAPEWGRSPSDG